MNPEAIEVHRPVVKHFIKRRIVTLELDDLWGADLVIMNQYSSENDGYKYMLNVIDTYSKFAWSEPLKTKSGSEIVKAFRVIMARAKTTGHTTPNLLHTDKGREFVNKEFKQLLSKNGIRMYHTENEEKSAIVERFNRTLNNRMKVQFENRKSFKWIDILQNLIDDYNNSYHRTIKMRPVDVKQHVDIRFFGPVRYPKPKLKCLDRVRITIKKNTFANKYRRNWSREIFTVVSVLGTVPVTYKIEDENGEVILGSFYERELSKTVL